MRDVWVFVNGDGCTFGVAEVSHFPTEDDAWNEMYDTRQEERHARNRGVKATKVSSQAYHEHYRKCMMRQCDHHPQPAN
jgi:hypothetical protein